MALEASPAINRLLLILIGEMLLQANEDLAHGSHRPFRELAAGLREFSLHMAATVDGVGGALPPEVGRRYVKAMELFTGRGGVSHLDDFIRQLDLIADGRIKTSAHIVESKWQIIAEVARLMIELLVAMVISAFSAGGSAGQMALAMARSRVFVLSVMDNLLRRVHLMPTLSEAIDEAFQSFVVRLALILKGPKGQRPDGFDWGNILQDGLFGGLAGGLHGIFRSGADHLTHLLKHGLPNLDVPKNLTVKTHAPPPSVPHNKSPLPSPGRATPAGGGRGGVHGPLSGTPKGPGRQSVGSHVAGSGKDFAVDGAAESLAEGLGSLLLTGAFVFSPMTFLGAGLSSKTEQLLHGGVTTLGDAFRTKFTLPARTTPLNTSSTGATIGAGTDAADSTVDTVGAGGGDGAVTPPPGDQHGTGTGGPQAGHHTDTDLGSDFGPGSGSITGLKPPTVSSDAPDAHGSPSSRPPAHSSEDADAIGAVSDDVHGIAGQQAVEDRAAPTAPGPATGSRHTGTGTGTGTGMGMGMGMGMGPGAGAEASTATGPGPGPGPGSGSGAGKSGAGQETAAGEGRGADTVQGTGEQDLTPEGTAPPAVSATRQPPPPPGHQTNPATSPPAPTSSPAPTTSPAPVGSKPVSTASAAPADPTVSTRQGRPGESHSAGQGDQTGPGRATEAATKPPQARATRPATVPTQGSYTDESGRTQGTEPEQDDEGTVVDPDEVRTWSDDDWGDTDTLADGQDLDDRADDFPTEKPKTVSTPSTTPPPTALLGPPTTTNPEKAALQDPHHHFPANLTAFPMHAQPDQEPDNDLDPSTEDTDRMDALSIARNETEQGIEENPTKGIAEEISVSSRNTGFKEDSIRSTQIAEAFPWLSQINPHIGNGDQFATNCVLTTIAGEMSLRDDGVAHQAPPSDVAPAAWLHNFTEGRPWYTLAGFSTVEKLMESAPDGARGVVVTLRSQDGQPDHAFNVIKHRELGVVFLDGQTGREANLPQVPGVVEFVMTTDDFNEDTISAFTQGLDSTDLRKWNRPVGAIGAEVEIPMIYIKKEDPTDKAPERGDKLFWNDYGHGEVEQISLASSTILEMVSEPYAVVPGDDGYADSRGFARSVGKIIDLVAENKSVHAKSVGAQGFTPDSHNAPRMKLIDNPALANKVLLAPQYTVGVEVDGLYDLLRFVRNKLMGQQVLKTDLDSALVFGDEAARRFAEQEGRRFDSEVPALVGELLNPEDVNAVRGYTALIYAHAIASVRMAIFEKGRNEPPAWYKPSLGVKQFIAAASRHTGELVRREALSPAVQDFLNNETQRLKLRFEEYSKRYASKSLIKPLGVHIGRRSDSDRRDFSRIEDYLDDSFRKRPLIPVVPQEFGISTSFKSLDYGRVTRRNKPLLLIELRNMGLEQSIHGWRRQSESVTDAVKDVFKRATLRRTRLSGFSGSPRETIKQLSVNPVVRDIQDLFDSIESLNFLPLVSMERNRRVALNKDVFFDVIGDAALSSRKTIAPEMAQNVLPELRKILGQLDRVSELAAEGLHDTRQSAEVTEDVVKWFRTMRVTKRLLNVLDPSFRDEVPDENLLEGWPVNSKAGIFKTRSSAIKRVDASVEQLLMARTDPTRHLQLLADIQAWRRSKQNSSKSSRAGAVADLERRVIHEFGALVTPPLNQSAMVESPSRFTLQQNYERRSSNGSGIVSLPRSASMNSPRRDPVTGAPRVPSQYPLSSATAKDDGSPRTGTGFDTSGREWIHARRMAPPVERSHTWANPLILSKTDEERPVQVMLRRRIEEARDGDLSNPEPLSDVTSRFAVRRFIHEGKPITDLTVRVQMNLAPGVTREAGSQARAAAITGVEHLNAEGVIPRLKSGDRLHVTLLFTNDEVPLEPHDQGDHHLAVELVNDNGRMDQGTWQASAGPLRYAHEIAHQIGLHDNPQIRGALLGEFGHELTEEEREAGLFPDGLRSRDIELLSNLIGEDLPLHQDRMEDDTDRGDHDTVLADEPVSPVAMAARGDMGTEEGTPGGTLVDQKDPDGLGEGEEPKPSAVDDPLDRRGHLTAPVNSQLREARRPSPSAHELRQPDSAEGRQKAESAGDDVMYVLTGRKAMVEPEQSEPHGADTVPAWTLGGIADGTGRGITSREGEFTGSSGAGIEPSGETSLSAPRRLKDPRVLARRLKVAFGWSTPVPRTSDPAVDAPSLPPRLASASDTAGHDSAGSRQGPPPSPVMAGWNGGVSVLLDWRRSPELWAVDVAVQAWRQSAPEENVSRLRAIAHAIGDWLESKTDPGASRRWDEVRRLAEEVDTHLTYFTRDDGAPLEPSPDSRFRRMTAHSGNRRIGRVVNWTLSYVNAQLDMLELATGREPQPEFLVNAIHTLREEANKPRRTVWQDMGLTRDSADPAEPHSTTSADQSPLDATHTALPSDAPSHGERAETTEPPADDHIQPESRGLTPTPHPGQSAPLPSKPASGRAGAIRGVGRPQGFEEAPAHPSTEGGTAAAGSESVAERWAELSSLAGKPRSRELKVIDQAVRAWVKGKKRTWSDARRESEELLAISDGIHFWRQKATGKRRRQNAVDKLEAEVEREIAAHATGGGQQAAIRKRSMSSLLDMEELRTYLRRVDDRYVQNIELRVHAAPGPSITSKNFLRKHGHAWLEITLPKGVHALSGTKMHLSFWQADGLLSQARGRGTVSQDTPGREQRANDTRIQLLVSPAQLARGLRYADEQSKEYSDGGRNSTSFVRGMVKAITGERIPGFSNTPGGLAADLRTLWADIPGTEAWNHVHAQAHEASPPAPLSQVAAQGDVTASDRRDLLINRELTFKNPGVTPSRATITTMNRLAGMVVGRALRMRRNGNPQLPEVRLIHGGAGIGKQRANAAVNIFRDMLAAQIDDIDPSEGIILRADDFTIASSPASGDVRLAGGETVLAVNLRDAENLASRGTDGQTRGSIEPGQQFVPAAAMYSESVRARIGTTDSGREWTPLHLIQEDGDRNPINRPINVARAIGTEHDSGHQEGGGDYDNHTPEEEADTDGLTAGLRERLDRPELLAHQVTGNDVSEMLVENPVLAATWALAPDTPATLGQIGLGYQDRARLVVAHPELDPALAADLVSLPSYRSLIPPNATNVVADDATPTGTTAPSTAHEPSVDPVDGDLSPVAAAVLAEPAWRDLPPPWVQLALDTYEELKPPEILIGRDAHTQGLRAEFRDDIRRIVLAGLQENGTTQNLSSTSDLRPLEVERPVRERMIRAAQDVIEARETGIGLDLEQSADWSRYKELTDEKSSFRRDLKVLVNNRMKAMTGGKAPLVSSEQITRAWQRLAQQQRGLPISQLSDRIAMVLRARQRAVMPGSGGGLEAEFTEIIKLPQGTARQNSGKLLAFSESGEYRIVVEEKFFYKGADGVYFRRPEDALAAGGKPGDKVRLAIPEFVSDPLQIHADEEFGKAPKAPVFDALVQLESDLSGISGHPGTQPTIPLRNLLSPEHKWVLTDLGSQTLVGPRAVNDWSGFHAHYTFGVPVDGMFDFLEHVRDYTWRDRTKGYYTKDHLSDGLALGTAVAERFFLWSEHRSGNLVDHPLSSSGTISALEADPSFMAVRGYMALFYDNVAALVQANVYEGLRKVNLAVLSRNSMADIFQVLPDPVKQFLKAESGYIMHAMEKRILARIKDFAGEYRRMRQEEPPSSIYSLPGDIYGDGESPSVGKYVADGLGKADSNEEPVAQGMAFGANDLDDLDWKVTFDEIPMVVVEVRSYGARHVESVEAERQYSQLETVVRGLYERAEERKRYGREDLYRIRQSVLESLHDETASVFLQKPRAELVRTALRAVWNVRQMKGIESDFQSVSAIVETLDGLDSPRGHILYPIVVKHLRRLREPFAEVVPSERSEVAAARALVDQVLERLKRLPRPAPQGMPPLPPPPPGGPPLPPPPLGLPPLPSAPWSGRGKQPR